jgi:hypothetical protein
VVEYEHADWFRDPILFDDMTFNAMPENSSVISLDYGYVVVDGDADTENGRITLTFKDDQILGNTYFRGLSDAEGVVETKRRQVIDYLLGLAGMLKRQDGDGGVEDNEVWYEYDADSRSTLVTIIIPEVEEEIIDEDGTVRRIVVSDDELPDDIPRLRGVSTMVDSGGVMYPLPAWFSRKMAFNESISGADWGYILKATSIDRDFSSIFARFTGVFDSFDLADFNSFYGIDME